MASTSMNFESWQETALLTLKQGSGSTAYNFALITESFELNTGEKAIEGLATVSGGRIAKWTPEGDTEFTAKVIPIGIGTDDQTSLEGFWNKFQPQASDSYTQNGVLNRAFNKRFRNKYTVAILQTSTTYPADATASVSSADAIRFAMRNAYITKVTHSFGTSDGLTGEITIKCPAFDKTGASNVLIESMAANGATAMGVLSWSQNLTSQAYSVTISLIFYL